MLRVCVVCGCVLCTLHFFIYVALEPIISTCVTAIYYMSVMYMVSPYISFLAFSIYSKGVWIMKAATS